MIKQVSNHTLVELLPNFHIFVTDMSQQIYVLVNPQLLRFFKYAESQKNFQKLHV